MKKILLPSLIIILFSCSRQDMTSNNSNNGDAEISFDLNGVHYVHTGVPTIANGGFGVDAIKYPGNPGFIKQYYAFRAATNVSNGVEIFIVTDSLKTTTYHLVSNIGPGVSGLMVNGEVYSSYQDQDGEYIDITITSYQNGVVNGNFTGKVSKLVDVNLGVFQKATVTNGRIKNVKIRYL